jgi:hypothetical protein
MDYCFVRRDDEEHETTILVLKDRFSHAVQDIRMERSGAEDEDAISRALECVRGFGHRGRLILKTENEPAILALKNKLLERLTDGAIALEPPPHESESNGGSRTG